MEMEEPDLEDFISTESDSESDSKVSDSSQDEAEEKGQIEETEEDVPIPVPALTEATTVATLPDCLKKRSYACPPCDLLTHNPRIYLHHLRDTHNENFKVHECKLCIYASKGAQNLGRHILMCHGPGRKEPAKSSKAGSSNGKAKKKRIKRVFLEEDSGSVDATQFVQTDMPMEIEEDDSPPELQPYYQLPELEHFEVHRPRQTHWTKGKVNGIVKIKKRREYRVTGESFSCPICNYVTDIKSRFTKHVRYHSMPVTKCEHCDFKSPYKWNLDRHALSHNRGGEKVCPLCSFSTDIKQSLTFHLHTHHCSVPPEEIEAIILQLNSESMTSDPETSDLLSTTFPRREIQKAKQRYSLPSMKLKSSKVSKLLNRGKPVPNLIPISKDEADETKSDFLQSLALRPVGRVPNIQRKPQALVVGTLRQKQKKLESQKQRISNMAFAKKRFNSSALKQKLVHKPERFSILKKTLVGKSVNEKLKTIQPTPAIAVREPTPVKTQQDEGFQFSCESENCPAKFKTALQLKTHEAYHLRVSAFKCALCSYSVDVQAVLALHMRSHTEIKASVSVPPSSRAPSRSTEFLAPTFSRSRNGSSDDVDEAWLIGNPGFSYMTYLKNGRPKSKRYKCQMCPFSTEKRDQYRVHIRLHGSNQTYTCEICQYSVLHYANFKQHRKLHEFQDQQQASASIDGSSVRSSTPSTSTSSITSSEFIGMVFRCNMCPYATTTKSDLRTHMYRHISVHRNEADKNLHICSICRFGTHDNQSLIEHRKLHFNLRKSGEKPSRYVTVEGLEIFAHNEDDEESDGPGEKIFSQNETYGLVEDGPTRASASTLVDLKTGLTYPNRKS